MPSPGKARHCGLELAAVDACTGSGQQWVRHGWRRGSGRPLIAAPFADTFKEMGESLACREFTGDHPTRLQ